MSLPQDKKHNARLQKWRLMMQQGVHKDKQLLKNRIRKGIPTGIRMVAWPQIVNLKVFIEERKGKYTYDKLIKEFSNNIYEIALDIPRTFPQEQDSKVLRKSLNNVLKAISLVYPKIGYCQGMNFSALRLLQILDDQTAFWLLHHVYDKEPSIIRNFIEPKEIERQNQIFTELMKEKLPKYYDIFKKKSVTYEAYTIKWFMTLYSGSLSQELFYRIFQVFLYEGWSIIFAVGLALLKNNQKQILTRKAEELFFLLSSEIYHIQDVDAFMNLAYSFDITPEKVRTLGNTYDMRVSQSMRESSRLRHHKQIQKREASNRKTKDLFPQQESIGLLSFQSKAEEVNFDIFECLQKPGTKKPEI